MPSKISVSDGDGEGVATGIGDLAAIVAYQATRQDEKVFLFPVCERFNVVIFFQTEEFQKQALTPLSKQITIVSGRGGQQAISTRTNNSFKTRTIFKTGTIF